MSKIVTEITVEISNIEVDEKAYSFDYEILINANFHDNGSYDGTHSRADWQRFKKDLENGYAVEVALEQMVSIELNS
jgi:hypothetical protein